MRERASGTGMRELHVRALLHSASLGSGADGTLASHLVEEIDNPTLRRLVVESTVGAAPDREVGSW